MEKIYTLYVNNYNLKYSNIKDIIHISVPNYGIEIPIDSISLPNELKNKLKGMGWRSAAINTFESYILNANNWKNCLSININTGKITGSE
jgi:hypothetical protein